MGVPGFNSWFARNHRHAYVSYVNKSWDHVYIDMASILHAAMKKAYTLPQFHRILFIKLDYIMATASPRKSVMFALDGPAPLAKLLTQRKRRAKESASVTNATAESAAPYVTLVQPWSTRSKSSLASPSRGVVKQPQQGDTAHQPGSSDVAKSGNAGGAPLARPRKQGLSTMGLTPGTPLMAEIERSLEFYICQRLQKWKHLEFELSGARVQGEGETKIIKKINSSTNGSHVIVGNDSDIILMSLMCPVRQLYILAQQTRGKSNKYSCISLDALHLPQRPNPQELEAIAAEGPSKVPAGAKMDLVLCTIIAKGNDYLPAVRGVGGPANSLALWQNYLRLRQRPQWISQNLVIVNSGSQTAKLNADLLIELLTQGNKTSQRMERGTTAANLLPPDAKRYAQGLVWVLNMYLKAECPDYRWIHDNEAPSMHQLVEAIKALKKPQARAARAKNTGALLPPVCALSLLPRSGRQHLPQALQHLMDKDSPVADVFDNCDVCDGLAAENVKVTTEYMKLHTALQAAVDLRQATSTAAEEKASSTVSQIAASNTDSAAKPAASGSSGSESDSDPSTSASDKSHASSDSHITAVSSEELLDPGDSESEEEEEDMPDVAALQEADIQQMQSRASQLRAHMNSLRSRKDAHLSEAHPYAPFPVGRLEGAVSGVPQEAFSSEERELTGFGQSHSFTWASNAKIKASAAVPFVPQVPAEMGSNSPVANIVRTPIIESRDDLPSHKSDTSIVASRQTILVQSLVQQQQSWQKQSLPVRSLQRQAVQLQHAKMVQLSHWGSPSRLQSGSVLWRAQGYRQHAPVRGSLLAQTGLHRLCFGSLPF